MTNIQTIQNVADCVPLYLPHSLYLKPLARMNISVALPLNKTGKSISNLDIMDKLSAALKPDKFLVLKVSKSTVEFIRFEAELEERPHLRSAIGRLDGVALRIIGFSESFRVRCSEPKDDFPTRHDWDSFFRDASHMDEMKAGERPDTIHITHLPIRWLCPRHAEHDDNARPSESIFRRIFEKFGSVRCVDIPICDPYRNKMNADINGMKTFSFEQDVLFEAYVQFDEYVGFVRAMDEFRGMKLVRKFVDKTQALNISVQFDKTKHLSEAQLQRRERVRKRLIGKAQAEEEEIEQKKKLEKENVERERQKEEQLKLAELEKQREREEKRKEKHLKKIQERGQVEISQKIRVEERKLMIAQRKLESIRILEQLFGRIKLKHASSSSRKHQHHYNQEDVIKNDLRDRLVQKYKTATEKLLNEQKKKVEEIKNETPLLGLLKSKKAKHSESSDDVDDEKVVMQKVKRADEEASVAAAKAATSSTGGDNTAAATMNPFKAMAALATAGGAASAAAYSTEQAAEWMKSLSMFPYVPQVFPGMPALYHPHHHRPPVPFPVSANYRGFAPRMRRPGGGVGPRGRGRGRGAGGSYYNNNYNNRYNYDEENYDDGDGGGGGGSYYRRSSYSRSRSRSRSRRRSHTHSRRSRSRSRSRRRSSRSRSRSHSTRRSRTRRHSRSKSKHGRRSTKSRTRSKSPAQQQRVNRKLLASTRRSRSASDDWSRSRSRSRTPHATRSKRSWSRRGRGRSRSRSHSRTRSRSRSTRSHRPAQVVIETDKLVRTAEEIRRTIEKNMQERMRVDEREIKDNFDIRRRKQTLRSDVDLEASAAATEAAMDRQDADKAKATAAAAADLMSPTADRKEDSTRSPKSSSERAQRDADRSERSDGAISRHNSSDRDAIDALLSGNLA